MIALVPGGTLMKTFASFSKRMRAGWDDERRVDRRHVDPHLASVSLKGFV